MSSGLAGLDAFVGGGLPLGTMVVVEEDGCGGSLTRALLGMFLAQAGPSIHRSCVAAPTVAELGTLLGAVPSLASRADAPARAAPLSLGSAWQYAGFVAAGGDRPAHEREPAAAPAAGPSSFRRSDEPATGRDAAAPFCSSFDLDRPVPASAVAGAIRCEHAGVHAGGLNAVHAFLRAGDARPGRAVVLGLGRGLSGAAAGSRVLAQLRAIRRSLATERRCVALVTIPPLHERRGAWGEGASSACLRIGGAVFRLAAFGQEAGAGAVLEAPSGFGKEYSGLLRLARLPAGPSLVPQQPRGLGGASVLLVRRARRRIALEPMHLPPEGEDAKPREQSGTASLATAMASLA